MHESLARLQPYPFEKLARLRAGVRSAAARAPIDLSIGEPRHETPRFIVDTLAQHLPEMARYPTTRGSEELRRAIVNWLLARFHLPANSLLPDVHVLPVNGTREALFAIAQCVISRVRTDPLVVMPNPFYQIYEGAALLAGATPWFINCLPGNGFEPDFQQVSDHVWQRCQLLYVCSPGNPTGNVLAEDTYAKLFALADRYDFIIAADECYSEIYLDEAHPPTGLLGAAAQHGRSDYRRCIVFHSLSKRSSTPGMRSGFVAGDPGIIRQFLLYRTYHGCAMPFYAQAASAAAWQDEEHVRENRRLYRQKFDAVLPILEPVLDVQRPAAGFYLWPRVAIDDTEFTRGLLARENVTVLPGSYLARDAHGTNPGAQRVRIALVPPLAQCVEAAHRIRVYVESLQ
ncbi:MAG: succinyldiaminopimelate transaminase [Chromatiales bacterium]